MALASTVAPAEAPVVAPAATPVATDGHSAAVEGGASRIAQPSTVPTNRGSGRGGRAAEGAGAGLGDVCDGFGCTRLHRRRRRWNRLRLRRWGCTRRQLSLAATHRGGSGGGQAAGGAGTVHGAAATAIVAPAVTAADEDGRSCGWGGGRVGELVFFPHLPRGQWRRRSRWWRWPPSWHRRRRLWSHPQPPPPTPTGKAVAGEIGAYASSTLGHGHPPWRRRQRGSR